MELRMIKLLILLGSVVPLLAQVTPSISSFSVQQTSTSVRITLMLNSAVIGRSGCFFDKLAFSDTTAGTGITPRYEGICEFNNSTTNTLTGIMDTNDYTELLQFSILTAVSNSFIVTTGKSPVSLVPGISVIALSVPLMAAEFVPVTRRPALISFDIDQTTNRLLLHFDGLMDNSTLDISNMMLSSSSSSSPITLMQSIITSVPFFTTLCVTLSSSDLMQLTEGGICQSINSCFCSFSSQFISDYGQNLVQEILSSEPLQVSIFRRSITSSSPVYMRLSLLYVGCNAIHTLTDDEVYILRPYEYVTRIDCFTNDATNSSNIRPRISREISFSGTAGASIEDYVGYDWPLNTYLNFSRALPSQLYGQYVCRSSIGYYTRNYVHDNNFGIELPDGSNFRLPLHSDLSVPFYFGSYPQTNLSRPDISFSLFNVESGDVVSSELILYERKNPFHVDIKFSMVQEMLSGNYDIRINVGQGAAIAMQRITIEVTAPTLTLIPEVATILPGQEEIILMCITNSASLRVTWYSSSFPVAVGHNSTLRVEVVPDTTDMEYNCSVTDPTSGNVVATAVVPVRRIQENLTVFREGMLINNNSLIQITNNRNGDLNLQCLDHVESELTWIVLPDNGSLTIPSDEKGGSNFVAIKSGNQANLTIENLDEPFRGLLKCISSSGQVVNIRVVGDDEPVPPTCKEEVDSTWGVRWNETVAGSRDFQPCPMGGVRTETYGFVLRLCNMDGEWNSTIDITNCSSANFIDLERTADSVLFELRDAYNQGELDALVSELIRDLKSMTQPKLRTYFPRDLDIVNNVLENLVSLLSEEPLPLTHVDLVDVLDNLLQRNNIEGWRLLTEVNKIKLDFWEDIPVRSKIFFPLIIKYWKLNNGGQRLLNILEGFGMYLLESLQTRGSQSGNRLTIPGENGIIVYNAMVITEHEEDVTYPVNLNLNEGARITLPAGLLSRAQATGAVHIIMQNFGEFLPKPNRTLSVASKIMSSQIMTASGIISTFNENEVITLEFITERVPRATDPVCLFVDESGLWSAAGIETILPVNEIEKGEVKQFSVTCSSNHLTAFGVAVDTDASDFNFTIPVYVGCGFVIFSSVLSIFSLLLSFAFDKLRRYSIVAFLIHLSFIASLLCAYIAFLAGIEQALNQRLVAVTVKSALKTTSAAIILILTSVWRAPLKTIFLWPRGLRYRQIGCVAVAGLLHYFFTAAFAWLLMETLLLVFFKTFANYCGLFVIISIIGWGLPALPTVISLGILHEDYGTVSDLNCWFFFDGQFTDVVLGFIIPKLIIIGVTLLMLSIGFCTNCKFSNTKMQPALKEKLSHLLWWILVSIFIFLIFLSASWVFALLLVNVYGLDSEILGWVFMAASILLSVWMFIFSVTIMVINQRVDYERLWSIPDPVYPQSDPGRGKGYQFTDMPSVDLTGRRTSTLTRPPKGLSNPAFQLENN